MPDESKKTTPEVVIGDDAKSKKKLHVKKQPLIILAIILLFVGFVSVLLLTLKSNNESETKKQTAKGYQSNISRLANAHAALLEEAVNSTLKGATPEDVKGKLVDNGKEISEELAGPYGDATEQSFNKAWDVYVDQTLVYAKASKNKDTAAKEKATQTIGADYVARASQLLHEKNKDLDQVTLGSSFGAYVFGVQNTIDAKVTGTSKLPEGAKISTNLKDAAGSLNVGFIYITKATIKQYPDQFKDIPKETKVF